MSQEENKKDGYAGWRRFRNRVNIGLIIIALIILYASFYFVGPISGKVVDAKTDEPIANIMVRYSIKGSDIFGFFNPGGVMGWGNDKKGYTDNNGVFKIPLSIALKLPFIQWLDSKRKIFINFPSNSENKNYDYYEEEFVFWPFRSFKFALVPIPETLDDCRDNLTEKEQYRCVEQLAGRDSSKFKLSEYYLMSKYLHILKNYCDEQLYVSYSLGECRAVLAAFAKDRSICKDDKSCFYNVAIDLKDKSWCEALPSPKESIYSREDCEKTIDTLTAEGK